MEENKINLPEKFSQFTEHWSPKVIADLNGQQVKLVKIEGAFTWHHHETEDELFYVVKGWFEMHYRDKVVRLNEGEMVVVPRMTEHKPVAPEECWIMLFEPASTLNTGNTINEFTKIAEQL